MRVSVLDIEPIEPAEGGSRQRLKGLYHALGPDLDVTYVGAFHWYGPEFRRLRHGPSFEEITVPFSHVHCVAAEALQKGVGGVAVVDPSFPRLGTLSGDYCRHARAAAAAADVVVFSHPWVFPIARDELRPDRQLIVYDAHNVETLLRRDLLGGTALGREIADEVEQVERALCHAADLVVACSHDDSATFAREFGLPHAKTRVCPNGVFAGDIMPADAAAAHAAKKRLGLGEAPVALFIGGHWPPNIEAAAFIRDRVAPACPDVIFALVGDAGTVLDGDAAAANLRIVGGVSEVEKRQWLDAADLGLNPMFAGSGTNIKMLDYMAAGLDVVTTPFGRRGIDAEDAFAVADAESFATVVADRAAVVTGGRSARPDFGRRGRDLIERSFDWANISAEFGAVIGSHAPNKNRPAPFFSVTVASLDRPEKLRRLFDLLSVQTERNFEVIVVDQSEVPFATESDYGFDLTIVHTAVRGAARARNVAADVARGRVLVFTDDDCEPCDTWLQEARTVFDGAEPVGLEGRVVSDRVNDDEWRSVQNYGIEGFGFMSCNLFATAEAFHAVSGFDPAFDIHDFRYDTDFGWRLETLGEVPFSERAFVYHPPWPRTIARESDAARNRMFEGDALLLRRHPARYRELFLREGQWRKGPDFWGPFLRGAHRYGIVLPDYIRDRLTGGGS